MSATLHPNLARIAASYQQIMGRLSRGEITTYQANVEVRELVARDDDGVQWTINPKDGGWLFLARSGEWTPGEPPASGLATVTPHDLRLVSGEQPVSYNPDWDLRLTDAQDTGTGLRGMTRRPLREIQQRPARWKWILVGAVVVLGGLVLWMLLTGRVEMIAPGPLTPVPAPPQ